MTSQKTFDCVESIRQIRDRLSSEIAEMTYDELARWLGSHRYTDPVLDRLAQKAAQHGKAAADGSRP